MNAKTKLALWEVGAVVWVCVAGSMLHFAFELSNYWTPMALVAAVNESAWEHTKMYFWPGLVFALAQYTYTRHLHKNYWQGKAAALAATPLAIFTLYYSYLGFVNLTGGKANLPAMLSIMVIGISAGQYISYKILTAESLGAKTERYATATFVTLVAMFSLLTFFPPRIFLFENFFCYTYTGEYGILEDYEPYRIFTREPGATSSGVNYCAAVEQQTIS